MSAKSSTLKRTLRSLDERFAAGKLKVNALDKNGLSLVHQFSYDGQLTGLQWTLQHGGDPFARSSEGCVAAHYAAAAGHLHILQYLQEHTTQSIDIKDNNGTSPLYIAAQEGQIDCVMWLTKYSGLPASEPSFDGMTAVHASAQEGHLDCIRYLVQFARCSPTQMDNAGCTPLHFASAEGHWKVVRWLLEHCQAKGDEVDKTGTAAIHLAAEYDQLKVLKVFAKLRNGLILQKDGSGRLPLDICIEKNHKQCKELLGNWYKQSTNADRGVKHRTSSKKVRFDEKKGQNLSTIENSPRSVHNNNTYTNANGFVITQGGNSETDLREKLRRDKEEWERSAMIDIDFEEKLANEKEERGRQENVRGSRNVRKRSSFKDKNAKYKARMKEQNRGSIGHMLDKLNLKKGLNHPRATFASLPYRTGERGSRPDIIQSVLEADKSAGRGFTRRPSFEFFQDLQSQLNSGKKREPVQKPHNSDVPVTIFHNGTLRASRDNLRDSGTKELHVDENSVDECIPEISFKPVEDEQTMPEGIVNDIPVSNIDLDTDSGPYRVVIDGAERRKQKSPEIGTENDSPRIFIRPKAHEPHPQRKIKLPKGFIGILPKPKAQPKTVEKENQNINNRSVKTGSSNKKKRDTLQGRADSNFFFNEHALANDANKEHYLIRSLPLPSHSSHGFSRSDSATPVSNDMTPDYKQNFSRWSSVRDSVGTFFSSLRSVKKRDKIYKVQSAQNFTTLYNSNDSILERKDSGKFNFIKSLQLKPKKRKSLSLEHLPYYASSGEVIQIPNNSNQTTKKRLSALQPGYTEPDLSKLTSMALDQTLKGRVDSVELVDDDLLPPPEPEESLDFVVSNKQTTGFELDSLKINNSVDGMETGKALMW